MDSGAWKIPPRYAGYQADPILVLGGMEEIFASRLSEEPIAWALFAVNFSWGVLLLVISGLVIDAANHGPNAGAFVRRFVFLVGLFWLVHGVYVLAVPMPLPPRLQWIRFR